MKKASTRTKTSSLDVKAEKEIEVFNVALDQKLSEAEKKERQKALLDIEQQQEVFTEFSITVTGSALDVILKKKSLLIAFYRLARYAAVVIACRVTPKQKSLLVKQSTATNPKCCSSLAIGTTLAVNSI